MNRNEIRKLASKAKAGDRAAFEALYNEYSDKVYGFAKRNLGDEDAARDVTAETFAAALENIATLREEEAFAGWLYSIAYRKCADHLRETCRTESIGEEELFEKAGDPLNAPVMLPDDYVVNADTKRRLGELIDGLSQDQRSAVILYYFDELPVSEVAKALGTNENNARQKLSKARRQIRKGIEKLFGKEGLLAAVPLGAVLSNLPEAGITASKRVARVKGISLGAKLAILGVSGAIAVGIGIKVFGDGGGFRPVEVPDDVISRNEQQKERMHEADYYYDGLDYIPVSELTADVEIALAKSYEHIQLSDNISISIPDSLSIYTPVSNSFIADDKGPKLTEAIKLLYDPDDFDKTKNPGDSISVMPINQDTENPSYQFFNETKDEHCAISRSGYIHLGSNELLDTEVIECRYVADTSGDETAGKILSSANALMKKAADLQQEPAMEPYLIYKLKSKLENTFYMVYYCKVIENTCIQPFGMEGALNFSLYDYQEYGEGVPPRWADNRNAVWLDESYHVVGLHIDSRVKAERGEEVKSIPALDSVLNYMSNELAPNLMVNITNIAVMYAADMVDRRIVPVWYIEFENKAAQSPDIGECNRLIINASTGLITSYIEQYYDEHQG